MTPKKILITGATGFLGRNLQEVLAKRFPGGYEIYAYNSKSNIRLLDDYTKDCEFVFHFAAVHRPDNEQAFDDVNHLLFVHLLDKLEEKGNRCPVLYTSSVQADNGTAYGKSKTAAEEALRTYGKKVGAPYFIYRLTNTFGPGARPNGHSVVATFCYNIARNLPIHISDRNHVMRFYYIEDVIADFIEKLRDPAGGCDDFCSLTEDKIFTVTLGELADILQSFPQNKTCRKLNSRLEDALYKTFISYCEE